MESIETISVHPTLNVFVYELSAEISGRTVRVVSFLKDASDPQGELERFRVMAYRYFKQTKRSILDKKTNISENRPMDTNETNEQNPQDPAIRHEFMDRSCTVLTMCETLLGDHPGLANGDLMQRFDEAVSALSALYQAAGRQ